MCQCWSWSVNLNQNSCFSITNFPLDPLASNKGFWADVLGVGNFYFEIGIVIIQTCLQTRSANGGVISLQTLLQRVRAYRKQTKNEQMISLEDLKCAIDKLGKLDLLLFIYYY